MRGPVSSPTRPGQPARAGDQPGLTVTITSGSILLPCPVVQCTATWCRCGKAEDVHGLHTPSSSIVLALHTGPRRIQDGHLKPGGRTARGGGQRQSARGWHGLRRFDSEVGLCMVSARERLGKRFLLLAGTGQGLLAFAKPNRLSDQDKIQSFPSLHGCHRKSQTRRPFIREAAWPLCLIDRWKAPCWPSMGLASLTGLLAGVCFDVCCTHRRGNMLDTVDCLCTYIHLVSETLSFSVSAR